MQVLVTGATGFVGSHLVRRLNARGIRPRVLVRPTSNRYNLQDLDAEVIEGDLLDYASVVQALDGCTRLYHAAGFVSPRPSHRQRLFDSNVRATENAMDAAAEVGVERIVYLGSTTAIGVSEGPHPITEDAPYNLGGTGIGYFEAKRASELAVRRRIEDGLPVVSVYPGYCLGPGDVYLSSSRIITAFCKGQIFFAPKGGMTFVDVRDAAEALALGMEKGRIGERYFAGGYPLTYREFFERLASIDGRRAPRLTMPNWLLHVLCVIGEPLTDGDVFSRLFYMAMSRYHWYDSGKAQRELGWTMRPLDETLRDALAWLRQEGYI